MTIILRNPSNDPVPNRVFGDAPVKGVSVIWHNGNDYGWGDGRQVYAAAAGRVVSVHWSPSTRTNNRVGGYGNWFKVDHGGGYETLYAHLPNSAMLVHLGQHVEVGERIGTMGDTGNAAGVHLHFELRFNGRIIDPNPHFGAASSAAANDTNIIGAFLMALTDDEQKELLTLARNSAGYLYKGGDSVDSGKRGVDFNPKSAIGRLDNLEAATFRGGPSMLDGGKSISQSLAEIHQGGIDVDALADAIVKRLPASGAADVDAFTVSLRGALLETLAGAISAIESTTEIVS